jgi:hypothetical protein
MLNQTFEIAQKHLQKPACQGHSGLTHKHCPEKQLVRACVSGIKVDEII